MLVSKNQDNENQFYYCRSIGTFTSIIRRGTRSSISRAVGKIEGKIKSKEFAIDRTREN